MSAAGWPTILARASGVVGRSAGALGAPGAARQARPRARQRRESETRRVANMIWNPPRSEPARVSAGRYVGRVGRWGMGLACKRRSALVGQTIHECIQNGAETRQDFHFFARALFPLAA